MYGTVYLHVHNHHYISVVHWVWQHAVQHTYIQVTTSTHTPGGTACVRDVSSVVSLGTVHATDGLVDTIPDTSRCTYTYTMICCFCYRTEWRHTGASGDVSSIGAPDTLHTTDGLCIPCRHLCTSWRYVSTKMPGCVHLLVCAGYLYSTDGTCHPRDTIYILGSGT